MREKGDICFVLGWMVACEESSSALGLFVELVWGGFGSFWLRALVDGLFVAVCYGLLIR